jgi:nitrate reductase gamma subunit
MMYEFITGPLVWISFGIFFAGLAYQFMRFIQVTQKAELNYLPTVKKKKKKKSKKAKKKVTKKGPNKLIVLFFKWTAFFKNSILFKQPFMMGVSIVFHILLFVVPLLTLAHNSLIKKAIGFSLPSLSAGVTDVLTFLFLICAFIFLVRRIFFRKVRSISTLYDYLVYAITVTPFVTGFIAYHQWFDYKTVITVHILSGELMLLAIPFTKLGHMIYFFLYRFFIKSEYSFGQGYRAW